MASLRQRIPLASEGRTQPNDRTQLAIDITASPANVPRHGHRFPSLSLVITHCTLAPGRAFSSPATGQQDTPATTRPNYRTTEGYLRWRTGARSSATTTIDLVPCHADAYHAFIPKL